MKKILIALALVLAPSLAVADTAVRGITTTVHGSKSTCFIADTGSPGDACAAIISGVALNATAADRTIVFPLDKMYTKLIVTINHTNSAATTVDTAVTVSVAGSADAVLQSGSISSGTRTLSDFTDTKAVTGNKVFTQEYDVRGMDSMTHVYSGTSAGGSDTVIVHGVAVTGN